MSRGNRYNQTVMLDILSTGVRLVIAIDIGSDRSGYAWQFRTAYDCYPLDIFVNTHWSSEGLCSYKTLTALLLKPDKSVAEFGSRADKMYSIIRETEEDWENWYYFRGFKKMLYAKDSSLDSNATAEDANGRHLPASLVFGKSILFMKDHAIKKFAEAGSPYEENRTKWVITIPSTYSHRAKGLMKKAAIEVAGIPEDSLVIALEPECAAIYCSQLQRSYTANSVLIVLDVVEGAVDVNVLRIGAQGQMQNVGSSYEARVSMRIDDKFFLMLRDLIGQDVFEEFVTYHELDYLDLRMDFEIQEKEVTHPSAPDYSPRFRIRVPDSLKHLWERKTNKLINEIMKQEHMKDKDIKFASSRLTFPKKIILDMIDERVKEQMNIINRILVSPTVNGLPLTTAITVGGFGLSSYVIKALGKELGKKNIRCVRPQLSEVAVLFGAVLFGNKEDITTALRKKYKFVDTNASSLSNLCFFQLNEQTVGCVFI